ncbi:MAG: sensor histidine kinase [Candidatus Limnocylindrales bacterium]
MDRLGVRLALAIGGAVAVVIVIAGVLVNVVVGSHFTKYLEQEQAGRRDQAAALVADAYRLNGSLSLTSLEVRQVAALAGGPVAVLDASGHLVERSAGLGAALGGPLDSAPIVVHGQTVGRLEVQSRGLAAPAVQAASAAFRRATDQTLLVAGLVAVAASVLVSLAMGLQLTRPLASLAAAAHRLGSGDLSTRVPVPTDREGHDLAIAFNAMAESLERSEQLRRQAASDLAHEIATPVTVLTTQLDAMADGVTPATADQLAATRETAGEVARLVGDLHDLAAAEGASLLRAPEQVDLLALARDSSAAVQALFGQRGVALVGPALIGAGPVRAEADPRQVGRALQNLLTNAAVYTPPGGTVRLSVAREGGSARIRVADTGPGIPPEHQTRVFERFYRADPARARRPGQPGGTGIGLTVARELMRANGGDVQIESSSPQGTTFMLELPVVG